jgi:hypothetical protein
VRRLAALLVMVLLMPACSERGSEPMETTTTLTGLPLRCQRAADALGFTVPCPGELPTAAMESVDCCVAASGGDVTLDQIFWINLEGYDPATPSPVQHLIVEARRIERAPPRPCFDGEPAGSVPAGDLDLTLLECPTTRTLEAQAEIRHGEGAHSEHLLGHWDESGVRYVVSVHGHSAEAEQLVVDVAASIELVAPR